MNLESAPSNANGMSDPVAAALARLASGFRVEAIPNPQQTTPVDVAAEAATSPQYNSLFDAVDWAHQDPPRKKMVPVQTVADRLLEALTTFAEVPEYNIVRALETARLVTSLVDYKVKYPDRPALPGLIHHAVNAATAVYRQDADAVGQIEDLLLRIREAEPSLFKARAQQDLSDRTTWKSLHPEYSQATAKRIAHECNGMPILLLPLTRGGFAGGLDVFLRYNSMTQNNGSVLYPIRFSAYKADDVVPQITSVERGYLWQWAKGRHVVVFDDDSALDVPYVNTLTAASLYLRLHIIGRSPLLPLANIYIDENNDYIINTVP